MITDARMLQATRDLRDAVLTMVNEEVTNRQQYTTQHMERMSRIDRLQDMADELMERVMT